jgi:hypothetical protein
MKQTYVKHPVFEKSFKSTTLLTEGMSKASAFWFIRDGLKLRQCSKEDFDKAITEGKSVKYGGYADRKSERIADTLESSRMEFLRSPELSPIFRAALTNPENVIDVQIITLMEPDFWVKESKDPKFKKIKQT